MSEKTESVRSELESGSGFVFFRNMPYHEFLKISENIGTLQVQNNKDETIVTVKNRGTKMAEGGRYHQSNEGGSIHTDSPHWENIVDYVGLYCSQVSHTGGETLLCDAADVYQEIKQRDPSLVEVLSKRFYFDKKEYLPGESKTLYKPILFRENDQFCFRYLRDYVESGHQLEGKKLSNIQTLALNCLDEAIRNNTVKYRLQKNDAIIFNNLRVFHGRLSYTDSEKLTRNLKRIWLCKH